MIVGHRCLKCTYEVDSLPRSKSRERGSVHINFPRPLHEVERTSKWRQGFPRGEVLREVRKCVSKSGLERSTRWLGFCVSKVMCVYVQVSLGVLGSFTALYKNVSLTVMERDV